MKEILFILLVFLVAGCATPTEPETNAATPDIEELCIDTDTAEIQEGYSAHNEDFLERGTVTAAYDMYRGVTHKFGTKTDFCETLEEAPEQEPFLIEYSCQDQKYALTLRLFCSEFVGEGYVCHEGRCVRENDQETVVKADCGGPYNPQVNVPFTFDGTKSQGDIIYYELEFGDGVISSEITGPDEILVAHSFEEEDERGSVMLMVKDKSGTKDYCQVFFSITA